MRRYHLVAIVVFVVTLVLASLPGVNGAAGAGSGVAAPAVIPASSTPPAPSPGPSLAAAHFGPALYLFRSPEGRSASPLVLHAWLGREDTPQGQQDLYLASGTPAVAAQAEQAGASVQLLDGDTAGKVYYLASATPADAAVRAVSVATLLYAGDAVLVLGLPASEEASRLEALLATGLSLDRIDPLPLATPSELSGPADVVRPAAVAADPYIAGLLSQVSTDAMYGIIADLSGERLVDLGGRYVTINTRYLMADHSADVETYLYRYYSGLGLATSYSAWSYLSNGYLFSGRNVIADIPGSEHPERIWLVGGHLDSNATGTAYTAAPGADDNATGIAATMAIAAALRYEHFADTVRFVSFGAEEFGQWGSKYYAQSLQAAGAQVMGYIDLDMIGYDGNHDRAVEIHTGTGPASIGLGSAFASANSRYGQGLTVYQFQGNATRFSDHSAFWDRGYPAFLGIEGFFSGDRNPYYHSSNDRLGLVDLDYVARYARTVLATVAELATIRSIPTATPTATVTLTPTPTPTVTPTPVVVCDEVIMNGGFEDDGAWTLGISQGQAGYAVDQAHEGLRSLFLGLLPEPSPTATPSPTVEPTATVTPTSASDVSPTAGPLPTLGLAHATGTPTPAPRVAAVATPSDASPGAAPLRQSAIRPLTPVTATLSSAYQTIDVPSGYDWVMLSFWFRPGSTDAAANSQEALLLDPATYAVKAAAMQALESGDTWRMRRYDLSEYQGQSLVLYFDVLNADPAGPRAWMYLDDVSVSACRGPRFQTSLYLPLLLN